MSERIDLDSVLRLGVRRTDFVQGQGQGFLDEGDEVLGLGLRQLQTPGLPVGVHDGAVEGGPLLIVDKDVKSLNHRLEMPGTGSSLELAQLVMDAVGFQGELVFDPSKPDGTPRKLVDVIFSFTHRETDVTEKYFVRVDVTEQFPFLVTQLSSFYDV